MREKKTIRTRKSGDWVELELFRNCIGIESHNESLVGNMYQALFSLGEAKKFRDELSRLIEKIETK